MTTILFDAKTKTMWGDGLMTRNSLVLMEDFVKVGKIDQLLYGYCGDPGPLPVLLDNLKRVSIAKLWEYVGTNSELLVYDKKPNKLYSVTKTGYCDLGQRCYATGSGGHIALAALIAGAEPKDAINIACKLDTRSGGVVKSVK